MKAAANTLEQLCESGRKITYEVVKPGHEVDDGIRFIRGGDVFQGRIAEDALRTISPRLSEQYKRTILRGGELLVSLVGNPGEVTVVPERLAGANIARQVGLVPLGAEVNPKFVMYFLRSPLGRAQLFTRTQGAVQQVINLTDLKTIEVPDVSLDVQDRIASILSTYDDLIENNRRRIQLLEQGAQLLYKEWFVHLRFPGHEHVKIKDGVPEEWEEKQVKDILGKVGRPRKIQKSAYLKSGPFPCVDQSREFIGGYTDDKEAVIDIGKPLIVFGDHTRILKFVSFPFASGADGTQLIVSNDDKISQEYLFFALDAIDLSNYFYARHFKYLKDQYIFIPSGMLLSQFTDTARPIKNQINILRAQCDVLAKARDLLLSRLMNGEISV